MASNLGLLNYIYAFMHKFNDTIYAEIESEDSCRPKFIVVKLVETTGFQKG